MNVSRRLRKIYAKEVAEHWDLLMEDYEAMEKRYEREFNEIRKERAAKKAKQEAEDAKLMEVPKQEPAQN